MTKKQRFCATSFPLIAITIVATQEAILQTNLPSIFYMMEGAVTYIVLKKLANIIYSRKLKTKIKHIFSLIKFVETLR